VVTVAAIRPDKNPKDIPYIKTAAEGFEVDYVEITNMGNLQDYGEVIIFHPRTVDNNPDWLPPEKVEDFRKFDFPDKAVYVFPADYGNIIADIEENASYLKKTARWVKIPTKEDFKSIHGHQAAAIVLWEYYKRKNLKSD